MPRKKKIEVTIQDTIDEVKAEIEKTQANLKALKAKLKELENKKAAEEKEEIVKLVLNSGKTIDEIKEMLK